MGRPERPGLLLKLFGAVVVVYLLAPLAIVVGMSFNGASTLGFPPRSLSLRWYEKFFDSPQWTDGVLMSLRLGLVVAVCATVLGYLLALGLDRSRLRGKAVVGAVATSPLVIPSVVLGVALYLVFARLHLVATFRGLVLAHVAMALPYVVVNVLSSLQLVDRDLERAARSLGANPVRAFVRVTLPLTAPGILAAAIFAFVISWDEVVVAIFLSGPETQTLPIVMWSQMRTSMDPTIAAVATVLMATTAVALGAGSLVLRLARRRVENSR